MTSHPNEPIGPRLHCARVNDMLGRLRQSFVANRDFVYDHITGLYLREKERRGGGTKEERKVVRGVDFLVSMAKRDETDRKYCWEDLTNGVRREQVRKVWAWMQNPENRVKPYYSLSQGCTEVWDPVERGYPNSRALYAYCHAHEAEFY